MSAYNTTKTHTDKQHDDLSWLAEIEPGDPICNGDAPANGEAMYTAPEVDYGDPWPIHTNGWQPVEAVDDPHRLARSHLGNYRCPDLATGQPYSTLRYHRDEWMHWDGACYRPVATTEINGKLRATAKAEFDRANEREVKAWLERGECNENGKPCPAPVARKVASKLIGDVNGALASLVALSGRVEAPAWLDHDPPFPALEVLPCPNGLIHIRSLVEGKPAIIAPTPRFFGSYALDYSFDPARTVPVAMGQIF